MAAGIGDTAPDFTLKDEDNNEVSLSDYRGTPVVLVFYAFTLSPVCEEELCAIRDDLSAFTDAGVQILAISCNARHVQKLWKDQMGLDFPVLSDFWPHGEVSQVYDAFNETIGCPNRVTVLIDGEGTIIDRFESPDIPTARQHDRYHEALAKLG